MELQIKDKAREYLDQMGYSTFQFQTREEETPHGLEACINTKSFSITITHDPDWRNIYNSIRADHIKQKNVVKSAYGIAEDVLESVVFHEHGHWRYCPYDISHLETIMDSVAKGLKDAGLNENAVKLVTHQKANEFEDIIVNSCLALNHPQTKKGRATKYLREAFIGSEGFDKSFGAFVDIQMRLYHPLATELAPTYCEEYAEIEEIVNKVLIEFGRELQLGPRLVENSIINSEREELIKYLQDPKNWGHLAYEYAKLTASLDSNLNIPDTPFRFQISNDDEEFDPKKKIQLIQIALQKGHDPTLYMDPFDVFRETHRGRGKILHNVFTDSESMEQFSLLYAWLNLERTKLPIKVKWSKTKPSLFDRRNNINFGRGNTPLITLPSAQNPEGSLADLLFVCDNSGSMCSEYPLLVDTVFAVLESLKCENKYYLLKYGLIQFSDSLYSSWSGWHQGDATGIEKEFYKTLQNQRFGSRTEIPKKMLEEAYHPNVLAVCISDGGIHNPTEALEGFSKYNKIIWFHIDPKGDLPEVPKELAKEKGAVVHVINSIEDLPNALLTTTSSIYARRNVN